MVSSPCFIFGFPPSSIQPIVKFKRHAGRLVQQWNEREVNRKDLAEQFLVGVLIEVVEQQGQPSGVRYKPKSASESIRIDGQTRFMNSGNS